MSAPIAKSQMAFELPKLSYIDTSWEEPAVRAQALPVPERGFTAWLAARIDGVREWTARSRSLRELESLSDRDLMDIGLNRGDFDRVFDDRYNQDLRSRGLRG